LEHNLEHPTLMDSIRTWEFNLEALAKNAQDANSFHFLLKLECSAKAFDTLDIFTYNISIKIFSDKKDVAIEKLLRLKIYLLYIFTRFWELKLPKIG